MVAFEMGMDEWMNDNDLDGPGLFTSSAVVVVMMMMKLRRGVCFRFGCSSN